MKIYDIVSHKSFDIHPDSINIYATRRLAGCYGVKLHECADKYKLPYASGVIFASEKVWKKIANEHRANW